MEDYEAQELEFWRKLDEEEISRSQMLKRSVAAATGLTVLASPGLAWARERGIRVAPPLKGKGFSMTRARRAGEEGRQRQHDRPAARLGELRRDHLHLPEEVRNRQSRSTTRTAAPRRRTRRSARSRATRALRTSSTTAPRSRSPAPQQGLFAKYLVSEFATIPRAMKDTRGYWTGDYWGAISIGYNANLVNPAPKSLKDLMNPAYKGKVALNGSPLTSSSAVAGVFAAALANGGSLNNVSPGIDFFATAEVERQLHPGAVDAADGRIRPDADLDRLGLPQPRAT